MRRLVTFNFQLYWHCQSDKQTDIPAPPLAVCLSVCLPVCVVGARVLVILRLTFSLNPKPSPTYPTSHAPFDLLSAMRDLENGRVFTWKVKGTFWVLMRPCLCVFMCICAYLSSCPIQFLGLPHWAFPCPVLKPLFLRFHLFLDRLINYVLLILGIASKSVGNLIFLYIVNITNFLHGFF